MRNSRLYTPLVDMFNLQSRLMHYHLTGCVVSELHFRQELHHNIFCMVGSNPAYMVFNT
jgi:hypothetical protein